MLDIKKVFEKQLNGNKITKKGLNKLKGKSIYGSSYKHGNKLLFFLLYENPDENGNIKATVETIMDSELDKFNNDFISIDNEKSLNSNLPRFKRK